MTSRQDDETFEQVCGIVAATLDVERAQVNAATCSANTPEWDSLAHLMILAAVEKAFALKLPRQAAYRVKTLGELAALVAHERGNGA